MAHYIALNKTEHQALGWRKSTSFTFAATDSAVPVLLEELPQLLPTLPLAFIQTPENDGAPRFILVALLSLTPGQNLYITPDGRWLGGYIPSSFRRYPFRLLPDRSGKRMVLCFNEASGQLTEQPEADGEPFFTSNGELAPATQRVLEFLELCEQGQTHTQKAVDRLAEHGLIKHWPVRLGTDENAPRQIKGIFHIDEKALKALDAPELKALQHNNALSLAYAQLLSEHRLHSFNRLYELQQKLRESQQPTTETDVEALFGGGNDTLRFD